MDITLTDNKWQAKGYWPWVPLKDRSMETGEELQGVTDWLPASVPGGVHYDLYRAGLIEHPYQDLNSLHCEWVENRWWVYRTKLAKPTNLGSKVELIFEGLDYHALIYLGGRLLGEHEGMFHPAVFDITAHLVEAPAELELKVAFYHPPDEIGQIGKTSLTHTQKSRFNYKWDFSTRLVNVGIWDKVYLRVHKSYSLRDLYVSSSIENSQGKVTVSGDIHENKAKTNFDLFLMVRLYAPDGTLVYRHKLKASIGHVTHTFLVNDPQLWYPHGHGGQPLYLLDCQLMQEDDVLDQHVTKIGIRSLEYRQNERAPADSLPYTFVINGKRLYIKGVNLTPLDHLYGNVTRGHYLWLIQAMKHANINMVRIWGGGIIERDEFYDLCDQHGILVWQEFIQSSSGIDNIPSKLPEFLALLELSAASALLKRRNHTALTVWSGGNELMSAPNTPSSCEDLNLSMLHKLVQKYDPTRLFLPTSASGPVEFITKEKGRSHDVHGHWHYQGNPAHYELYSQSDNLFHSEFGVDGVSSRKSLSKFLSKEHHYPTAMKHNAVWRHHGEWWGTYFRDQELFGTIDTLPLFVDCSQWVQAEGLRYILEANRRRQFQNSGSIIWQLNEPWPNVSCTNLIDYFGETKMAYTWVKDAFAPLHCSLEYQRLDYPVGSHFSSKVYLHGGIGRKEIAVTATVMNVQGEQLHKQRFGAIGDDEKAILLGELEFSISKDFQGLFFVRLAWEDRDNLYTFSTEQKTPLRPARELKCGELSIVPADAERKSYSLRNVGKEVLLNIYPEETTNHFWMLASRSHLTLFPGETKTIDVQFYPKCAGGFLSDDKPLPTEVIRPNVVFKWFNSEDKNR